MEVTAIIVLQALGEKVTLKNDGTRSLREREKERERERERTSFTQCIMVEK